MCRSIRRLRQGEEMASEAEIREAAVQFVRKISGFQKPSRRHEQAFERAVEDVSAASLRLLDSVTLDLKARAS